MAVLTGVVRRMLWMLVLALAGGAAYQWWRERQAPHPPAAPEWPPIAVVGDGAPAGGDAEPAGGDAEPAGGDAEPAGGDATPGAAERQASAPEPAAAGAADAAPTGTASVVNSLVDAPEARSGGGADAAWVVPLDDGSCPAGYPVKANDNSGIFHVPGGRFYDRTKPERCYADADAAAADGYRRAKS